MIRRAACIVMLAACGAHDTAPPREPPVAITTADASASARADSVAIDATLARMARVRELDAKHGVARVVLSRDDLLLKLRAHVERAVPRREIEREDAFLKAFSAIAFDSSYEREVYATLHGSLGGMYEPFDGKMYLPSDVAEDSITIAHESVHALQDQHFDLGAFEKYNEGASDGMLARACLAEGDAAVAAGESPSAEGARSYVEKEMAAPYVAGARFVRALRARGGWAMVDEAWTRAGLTTEQILHPEKWFSKESSEHLPAPTVLALGAEFRDVTSDVHGELGVSLVLGTFSEPAARSAEGWAGDTSTVARAGDRVAVAWRIRWDDEAGAKRAASELSAASPKCSDGFGWPLSVERRGRDLLLLAGPPRSDCALLARWSKEIFAN